MGRPRMNRNETKPVTICFQVTHRMKEEAMDAAHKQYITLSAWLREAVRRELERAAE